MQLESRGAGSRSEGAVLSDSSDQLELQERRVKRISRGTRQAGLCLRRKDHHKLASSGPALNPSNTLLLIFSELGFFDMKYL
jgi:hypothetical protein